MDRPTELFRRPGTKNWWVRFTANGVRLRHTTGTPDHATAEIIATKMAAAFAQAKTSCAIPSNSGGTCYRQPRWWVVTPESRTTKRLPYRICEHHRAQYRQMGGRYLVSLPILPEHANLPGWAPEILIAAYWHLLRRATPPSEWIKGGRKHR